MIVLPLEDNSRRIAIRATADVLSKPDVGSKLSILRKHKTQIKTKLTIKINNTWIRQ